jgi:dTDP-4-dehydrorhamnose reductase
MKIVVTGRQGQVVSCLQDVGKKTSDVEIVTLGRPELDLAQPETIEPAIISARPDVVVNAAAYTAVDKAEDEPNLAIAINATGAGAVAAAAAKAGVPIIQISTDYVFSGDKPEPYVESDPTGPKSVYGASKLEGERLVAEANPRHVILRTAWVYSPYGNNFVKTMLRLAKERDEIPVVSDQWGNPTSAHDIAGAIIHVAKRFLEARPRDGFGIFHLTGNGETSWSGFAREVFEISGLLAGPHAAVRDIASAEYPTKARRPANSRLDTGKLLDAYGWRAPDRRQSARAVVKALLALR